MTIPTDLLVDAAAVAAPDVLLLDVRWYLPVPGGKRGADAYAQGHLPGAVFVDLDADLTPPEGPGRHPIPDAARFQAAMRRAGVSASTDVVAYDDAGGSIAARLWWLLRRYGHTRARVLDGGIAAWTASGRPLTTEVPTPPPGDFFAREDPSVRVVDKAYVDRVRSAPDVVVLDARARPRYRGDLEPVDARPGHVPGAKSAPFSENLDADGRFLAPDALRARYAALGVDRAKETIVYCGSGVTACHDLLAIARAGLPLPALYEGSWSDWARDRTLPVATGD